MQTFRIALITKTDDCTRMIDVQGVPLSAMKATIQRMVRENHIPASATIHVEIEQTREVYFRNLLSSVPSLCS